MPLTLYKKSQAVLIDVCRFFDSLVFVVQHVFIKPWHGADLVAIGRPVIYGLALGGSVGVC